MSDVKRYEAVHLRYDDNNIRYGEGCEVEVVLASDYATLEAELATVKKVAYGNMELLDENRNLLAKLAKLRAVPAESGLDADDVRAACQNAIDVFAGEENAEQCREVAEYMREVLLADLNRAAPQPSAVPDGWKLVPVEPTPEMIAAVVKYDRESIHATWVGTWREFLAAAPSAPATGQGDGWIPVSERLPESERTVLAFYLNSHGKGRRVRAEYIAAKTKSADDGWDSDEPADYDEQADEYFWPAGWYEVMDNWDDLTHMVIHEGEVTHWMPLPESPAIAAARKGEGE